MSGSGPVSGSEGAPSGPYTNATPAVSDKGQKGGRTITKTSGDSNSPSVKQGQSPLPGSKSPPVSLKSRTVEAIDTLKSFRQQDHYTQIGSGPESTTPPQGTGYEISSLASSPQAAGNMTQRDSDHAVLAMEDTIDALIRLAEHNESDDTVRFPLPDESVSKTAPSFSDPSHVQGDGIPQVSVEGTGLPDIEDVEPLPPLTKEQEIKKEKFRQNFNALLQMIKGNKNVSSMGAGGASILFGALLMSNPFTAVLGAAVLSVGITVFIVGYTYAMQDSDDAPSWEPPENPDETKPGENNKNADEKKAGEGATPGQAGAAGIGGKFVKVDTPVLADPETSEEVTTADRLMDPVTARRRSDANLQHAQRTLHSVYKKQLGDLHQLPSTASAADAKVVQEKVGKELEAALMDVVADFCARTELDPADELFDKMGETFKLAAEQLWNKPDLTPQQREGAVITYFRTMLANSGADTKLLAHLYDKLGTVPDSLSGSAEVKRAAIDMIHAVQDMIKKLLYDEMVSLPSPPSPSNSSGTRNVAGESYKKLNLEDIKKTFGEDFSTVQINGNGMHIGLFVDAMNRQEKYSVDETAQNRILTSAISILKSKENIQSRVFCNGLLKKLDSVESASDYEVVREAFNASRWYKTKFD